MGNASEEFTKFVIIRGDKDTELFERIDVAGILLYKILDNTSTSLVKQDQVLNKQDIMINLQVDTKDEIKNMRGDLGNSVTIEFAEIRRKLQSIEDALEKIGVKVE
jgi:hypothetical protein